MISGPNIPRRSVRRREPSGAQHIYLPRSTTDLVTSDFAGKDSCGPKMQYQKFGWHWASVLPVIVLLQGPQAISTVAHVTQGEVLRRYITSTNGSTSVYPQIWIAAGLIECGAPLVADSCNITATSERWTTFSQMTPSPVSTEFTVFVGSRVGQNTFTPNVIATALALGPAVSKERLARRTGLPSQSLQPANRLALKLQSSESAEASFSPTSHFRPVARRSYDYDVCSADVPSEDFKSNSLAEICHFVANVNQLFVSLSPNTAAYLPSWISYVTSAIISIVQALSIASKPTNLNQEDKLGWKLKLRNVGACVVAVFRTALITIKIIEHRNSFKTLPLLSPVAWIDWVVVTELLWKRVPLLGWLGFGFVVALWGICLWLVIGYTALGYGTEQYQVLNIPDRCRHLGIPWQTDPRRKAFLSLHVCLFAFSSGAAIIAIYVYVRRRPRPEWDAYRTDFGEQQFWEQRRKSSVRTVGMVLWMAIGGVSCSGAVFALILNTYDYLLLQREGCYGSYINSRWGYLEADIVNAYIKVAEFFGVLV